MSAVGQAKQLAFTPVGPGPTSPILRIQSHDFGPETDVEAFKQGNGRTPSHWQGDLRGYIEITTSDIVKRPGFFIGQRFTNVILTLESAVASSGSAVGSDYTVTLNRAVLTQVGNISRDNANKVPSVYTLRFELSDHEDGVTPTYVEG
jgi:hypothetical protein